MLLFFEGLRVFCCTVSSVFAKNYDFSGEPLKGVSVGIQLCNYTKLKIVNPGAAAR